MKYQAVIKNYTEGYLIMWGYVHNEKWEKQDIKYIEILYYVKYVCI